MKLKKHTDYIRLITVGIIVLMFGGALTISASFINDPKRPNDTSDYEAENKYRDDTELYKDATRIIRASGNFVQYMGLALLSIGMIGLAIFNNKLSPYVRLGLLIAAGLIIGLKIGGGGGNFTNYYF